MYNINYRDVLNWYIEFSEKHMTITIEVVPEDKLDGLADNLENWYPDTSKEAMALIDEDGCITLPVRFEVCPTCDGKGKHVISFVDSYGISAKEFYGDPNFAEDYFRGTYDVPCYECDGCKVIPEIDDSNLDDPAKEILKLIRKKRIQNAMYVHECLRKK